MEDLPKSYKLFATFFAARFDKNSLGKPGRPKKGEKVDNIKISENGGDDPSYLTAVIARDHPEIHKRMIAGEYQSVRANLMRTCGSEWAETPTPGRAIPPHPAHLRAPGIAAGPRTGSYFARIRQWV